MKAGRGPEHFNYCVSIVFSFLFCCRRKLTNISLLLLREEQDYTDSFDKKNAIRCQRETLTSTLLPFDYCFVCIPQNVSHPD